MYVNEDFCISNSQRQQGWVTEVIDEKDGQGKIKVQVIWEAGKPLNEESSYLTDFEPASNWIKALVDG